MKSLSYTRPRPENSLDDRAGHWGMAPWEESGEPKHDLKLFLIQRRTIG